MSKGQILHRIDAEAADIRNNYNTLICETRETRGVLSIYNDNLETRIHGFEDEKRAQRVMQSLHDPELVRGKEAISNTASSTYEWLLEPDSDFATWLKKAGVMFWIRGKVCQCSQFC